MPNSRQFLAATALAPLSAQTTPSASTRDLWIGHLRRIATPVLQSLSAGRLKADMPVEAPHGNTTDRAQFTHLEAFGRTLAGVAPWLESDHATQDLRTLTLAALARAADPGSPDFLNFDRGSQPVVDAAFLALGLLRAPTQLWPKLDAKARANLLAALRSSRKIKPGFSNWLLFSATIEAFFCSIGESWDQMRVDYALRQHDEWYKGDGLYGDGPQFHWDYYNSFVIQPMLLAVLEAVKPQTGTDSWEFLRGPVFARAQRYAEIQERLIGPDGSFPAIGRSLAYRCGAFHHLAVMAWRKQLPSALPPAQARSVLTAVINRTLNPPGTFDSNGWLTIGLCGHQPDVAEPYISTGSAYLCATAFLPLGLSASDDFWTSPETPWTAKQVWSGANIKPDHAFTAQI